MTLADGGDHSSMHAPRKSDWFPDRGPLFHRLMFGAALLALALLTATTRPVGFLLLVIIAFAAWEATDLAVGVVHWACDKYGSYDHPLVGALVHTFREHHTAPMAVVQSSYIDANSDTHPLAVLIATLTMASVSSPPIRWFVFFFLLFGIHSAWIHRWVHMRHPPTIVAFLQRLGIVVTRKHHMSHHSTLNSHYCAISGHCDSILDRLAVWKRLEFLILRLFRTPPVHQVIRHSATGATPRATTRSPSVS